MEVPWTNFTLPLTLEQCEANEDLEFLHYTYTIKTKGIVWNAKIDVFHFKVTQLNETISPKTLTERRVT